MDHYIPISCAHAQITPQNQCVYSLLTVGYGVISGRSRENSIMRISNPNGPQTPFPSYVSGTDNMNRTGLSTQTGIEAAGAWNTRVRISQACQSPFSTASHCIYDVERNPWPRSFLQRLKLLNPSALSNVPASVTWKIPKVIGGFATAHHFNPCVGSEHMQCWMSFSFRNALSL